MISPVSSTFRGSGPTPDALLEKLEDPRIVEALVKLLDKSDRLALFVEVLEGFVKRSEGLFESVSKSVSQLGRAGTKALGESLASVDLDELRSASKQVQGMIPVVRDFAGQMGALKEAGVLDPGFLAMLGRAGRAAAAATQDPKAYSTESVGIFGLAGLLKDPDIARALNFFISFARHFGEQPGNETQVSSKAPAPRG